jgi:hypothetical protein
MIGRESDADKSAVAGIRADAFGLGSGKFWLVVPQQGWSVAIGRDFLNNRIAAEQCS